MYLLISAYIHECIPFNVVCDCSLRVQVYLVALDFAYLVLETLLMLEDLSERLVVKDGQPDLLVKWRPGIFRKWGRHGTIVADAADAAVAAVQLHVVRCLDWFLDAILEGSTGICWR